jgi:hypothetical protein
VAEDVLQEHLQGDRQAADVADASLRQGGEAVVGGVALCVFEAGSSAEGIVLCHGGFSFTLVPVMPAHWHGIV